MVLLMVAEMDRKLAAKMVVLTVSNLVGNSDSKMADCLVVV